MTKSKQSEARPKERGTLLSIWLILMALHGAFFSYLIFYLRQQQNEPSPTWVLLILFALSLAKIVAAIAIWYWKRWGLVFYATVVAVGMVVGLVLTASQLIVFHDIVPLVITGYLVKDKRMFFD